MQTLEQRRASNKKYYAKHKAAVNQRNKENKQAAALKITEYIRVVKRAGCSRCGYNKCDAALEFHHVGSKSFNIGQAVYHGYSLERIKEEVAKCILLCSNCHREEHASEAERRGRRPLPASEMGSIPSRSTIVQFLPGVPSMSVWRSG